MNKNMKEHHLEVVGHYVMKHIPGDPPWGNPHTVAIYGCKDCKGIHNYKERRGYKTIITKPEYEFLKD